MNAALMRQALQLAAQTGTVIAQHSQDHMLAGPDACADERSVAGPLGLTGWPWAAESTIIARDVQLAELTGGRLHSQHITTAESVEVVRWAKARGVQVSAEVTPHHLLLDSTHLTGLDTTFKVNPPLRGPDDIEALRTGLADGTIDVVGTDHAPHEAAAKQGDFAHAKPGMLGLEQSLASVMETMVHTGRMGWPDVVRVMSTMPMPRSCCSRRSRARISACTVTSSAVVGSSAIRSCGPQIRLAAIITRWRMPPESWCG